MPRMARIAAPERKRPHSILAVASGMSRERLDGMPRHGPSLRGRLGRCGRRRGGAWRLPSAPAAGPETRRKSRMSPMFPLELLDKAWAAAIHPASLISVGAVCLLLILRAAVLSTSASVVGRSMLVVMFTFLAWVAMWLIVVSVGGLTELASQSSLTCLLFALVPGVLAFWVGLGIMISIVSLPVRDIWVSVQRMRKGRR